MDRIQLLTGWLVQSLIKITRRGNEEYPKLFCLAGDHIGDQISINGLYERDILDSLFQQTFLSMKSDFSKGTCIDVGANIGNHTLYFSGIFERVISFEPNPIFCSIIRANAEINRANNIDLFDVGLSDSDKYLDYIFLKDALGSSHFTDVNQAGSSMQLRVRRGDDVISGINPACISLIKIDVEGHEVSALTGLRSTIEKHFPIILYESHPEKNAAEAENLQLLIRSFGYNHFYTYETKHNPYRRPFMKAMYRLCIGSRRRLQKLVGPLESKEYLLLIASPKPLII